MQTEEFWRRLLSGVEVAVADAALEMLLGIRDALRRFYLEHGESTSGVAIVVVPFEIEPSARGLLLSDEEMMQTALRRARSLHDGAGHAYPFSIACEGGLQEVGSGEECRLFVRSWAAVVSPLGEAVGASGSLQLPPRIVKELTAGELPDHLPGTRRRGGLLASLTAGAETRRGAVALATFHALASHFYEVMGGRP